MLLVYVTSKVSAEQKLIFLNWNLESESFLRVMVNTVVTDRTNKHSDRCVDDYHSQRINSFLSIFTMYFTVKSLYLFLSLGLGRSHTSLSPPPPLPLPPQLPTGICRVLNMHLSFWFGKAANAPRWGRAFIHLRKPHGGA